MADLQVRLVAPDGEIWSGAARQVVAKTAEGDIGILPGHEPVLALLVDGVVRIDSIDEGKLFAAVHGGFFSVDSDRVAVLAEVAERAEDIDVARAQAALDRAQAPGNGNGDADESERSARAGRRASARLRAAQQAGS